MLLPTEFYDADGNLVFKRTDVPTVSERFGDGETDKTGGNEGET